MEPDTTEHFTGTTLQLKKHYGSTDLRKVEYADDLFLLLDELGDELRNEWKCDYEEMRQYWPNVKSQDDWPLPPGFYHNRDVIVDAFKQNHLYTIGINENNAMFDDKLCREDPIFMKKRSSWPFNGGYQACLLYTSPSPRDRG